MPRSNRLRRIEVPGEVGPNRGAAGHGVGPSSRVIQTKQTTTTPQQQEGPQQQQFIFKIRINLPACALRLRIFKSVGVHRPVPPRYIFSKLFRAAPSFPLPFPSPSPQSAPQVSRGFFRLLSFSIFFSTTLPPPLAENVGQPGPRCRRRERHDGQCGQPPCRKSPSDWGHPDNIFRLIAWQNVFDFFPLHISFFFFPFVSFFFLFLSSFLLFFFSFFR